MATKKSPLARQKDEHESKEKLVDRVISVLGSITKSDEDKDAVKARLLAASNKKLLRLHEVGSEIKSKYGSIDKLAEAVGTALGRAKDAPFVEKLKTVTPAKLLDMVKAAEKRGKKKAA
ncbi:MAG TPA: hypothetical protein VGL86_22555 [Polyangia bacterium]|jgi:hypothetical protein